MPASTAREKLGQLYGELGKFKDTTVRGFRSCLEFSAAAKALASMFSSREAVAAG